MITTRPGKTPRIASLLPSATEMACALGLADHLVGVTHECDFPPEAAKLPVLIRNALPLEAMSLAEIDTAVSARLREGESLYVVDEALLRQLEPDLILIQDLCEVCAPSGADIAQVVKSLPHAPRVLSLTPKSLDGIFANMKSLGEATGREDVAADWIEASRARLDRIASATRALPTRPRVFCLEWIDPIYCSGHWVSEMVELAGGIDSLSRRGTDSVRVAWERVLDWAPEILIIMPCGFHLDDAVKYAGALTSLPHWAGLPAVRDNHVYVADASSYFARPGPRIVDGVELLGHLIHPETIAWSGDKKAWAQLVA